MTRPRIVAIILAFATLPARTAPAQGLDYVRSHYTKYDFRIAMRDGVKLFTSVYVPKDASRTYPILLQRTPYSVAPYGIDRHKENLGPSFLFGKAGYIVAYQDVRGCYLSEGTFVDMRPIEADHTDPKSIDESTDAFDTVDWLVKNVKGNNGKAGVWGISYPGFYAAAATIDAHPALLAASPQAPLVDWFLGDDVHHNGAFFLQQEFTFDAIFGLAREKPTTKRNSPFDYGTQDAYKFFLEMGPLPRGNEVYFQGKHKFWSDVMDHGTYDSYWKKMALLPHVKATRPAVMTVGGWYDAEDLYGPLHTDAAIGATGPESMPTLVMGPWTHGGWSRGDGDKLGAISFDAKTAEFYRETIEFPFFEEHLKGVKPAAKRPRAWAFETGRNLWHRHDAWPPAEARAKTLFFAANGTLGFDPPPTADPAAPDTFDADPAHPVPYTEAIGIGYDRTYPVADQRFAARRPDVLVYQTAPLDADVTIVGPIQARLKVATTGGDVDWVVKLVDVHPDDAGPDDENNAPAPGKPRAVKLGGYQQLVRGDVIRGKFRDSFETPRPFVPGEPTAVDFTLQDVYHTFRPGHRIMVQVQCSWFPLVDRNPQTFVDIYHAKPSDFHRATQTLFRGQDGSRLEVKVLP